MHDKYTSLISRAPEGLTTAPDQAYALTFNATTNRVQEIGPGRAVPAPSFGLHVYTVPTTPVETMFAVTGAIRCLKPDGREYAPGFCLKLTLSYISASGMQKLLLTARQQLGGRMPDCITLQTLYDIIAADVRAVCTKAAETFSHKQTLTYTQWWQDLMHGTVYRDLLYTQLLPVFNAYGFRLDKSSFGFGGLSPVPVE